MTEDILTTANHDGLRDKGVAQMGAQKCMTLDSIIQSSKGMSGPLFTLYASIMNTAELALTTNTKQVSNVLMEFMMRLVMSLMLVIPLVIFAVIMLIRVAYLWLIIVASPILALIFADSMTGGETSVL